jgi:ubiquinone/menaquinone biosynthesis C-methylase UbiE
MYNLSAYKSDASYISDIVRFDLPRLPALDGLHITHLQCHIGTDTLSLARLGAASVVGLDFSAESLKQARALADDTRDAGGSKLSYVQGDVYDSVKLLGHQEFDLVFTGIGALCWLPSVSRWARVVADLLKPGGRLFIREGHPILWAADDSAVSDAYPAEQLRIAYPYYENGRPIINSEGLSYVGDSIAPAEAGAGGAPSTSPNDISNSAEAPALQAAVVTSTKEFNHGLGEIIQALIQAGLRISMVEEHDSVPWNALPGRMAKTDLAEYRLAHGSDRMPCSYTIQAIKE